MVVDLGRGKLWLDSGEYEKAKRALEIFLSKEPNSYEGVITKARVFVKLNQTEDAVRYFTKAISLAPRDSSEIYLERSRTLVSGDKIPEALLALDEGIDKTGGLVTLQSEAIELELKLGNFDSALARLDRLAAGMPRKEMFLLRRAEVLLQAGKPCDARVSLLESQKLYEELPARKHIRAVKEQIALLNKLLAQTRPKLCG